MTAVTDLHSHGGPRFLDEMALGRLLKSGTFSVVAVNRDFSHHLPLKARDMPGDTK